MFTLQKIKRYFTKVALMLFFMIFYLENNFAQVHIGPGQTFANIQAAATTIKAGDTVFVHAGNYTGYNGIIGLKGTAAKPIVIMRFKNDVHEIAGNWQFQACEYLTFRYLNFKGNASSTGRLLNMDNNGSCTTQAKYIIFDSCYFSNVTDANAITAFKFGGVDYFQITNCVFKNIPNCSAFDFNVCHHGVIKGNRIENCLTGGHIKGGASDITMEQNIFINASAAGWVAFEFGGDTGPQFYCPNDTFEVKYLRFYSNLIIGGSRGFALSSARNCEVINNTFYNCSGATLRILNTSVLYSKSYNNFIENNIFAFGSNPYINGSAQQSGAAYFNNNIYYSLVSSVFTGPYWDTPEMDALKETTTKIYGKNAPMFVDTQNHNFHLVAASPAIGAGKNTTNPLLDFSGTGFKSPRSIGAFEFHSTSGIPNTENTKAISFKYFPNPTSGTLRLIADVTIVSIELRNGMGQVYLPDITPGKKIEIDLKLVPKGMYFLRVFGESGMIQNSKLILE